MVGTIILLGGMNDNGLIPGGWKIGLRWAGLPHRVVHVRWQQGLRAFFILADLWRTAHHRKVAADLAARIRGTLADFPGEPIHLFGHSAGTAVAAYALEQLAPDEAVTSAVLVGSALSPGYDLGPALARTRAGILSVESYLDCLYLGVGTSVMGSADRRWGPAAGMVGFRGPGSERVRRVRWSARMLRQMWPGGHLSEGSPWFTRDTLADWVRTAEAAGRTAG
jgi:pimeloyl-ACP methyl ester carboxylesterase